MSTRADSVVDAAADRLERFVATARRDGGLRAKLAEAFENDPQFLRQLKPSLIAARIRGQAAPEGDGRAPVAAAEPEQAAPAAGPRPTVGGGPNPWVVLGVAFAAGVLIARLVDWRGYAHPRD
jgi:hypothetical protein